MQLESSQSTPDIDIKPNSSKRKKPRPISTLLLYKGRVPHHTTTPANAEEGRGRGRPARIWRGRDGERWGGSSDWKSLMNDD
jgi:hypothetical protein